MADEISSDSREKSILDELAHLETVRKLIECPVCLELPLPPIYVCNKGHIVCNNCQARTYACPLCREHYSTTREFVAEGIIEKCILRCKYSDHGCPISTRGSEMAEHLDVCDYRPVKCVDCGGKLINFDEYEKHLLKDHRINGINQSRAYVIYSMNLEHQIAFGEKCCWPQYYLKAFGEVTFLLRLYATHWFVCAWISLLGPKSECSKYEALLEFHPTNDDSVVHTWQGPVNHFRDDPAKKIFLQGRGLITPLETLMQIAPVAHDHAEWLYNIEILQTNTEHKLDGEDINGELENEATSSIPLTDDKSQNDEQSAQNIASAEPENAVEETEFRTPYIPVTALASSIPAQPRTARRSAYGLSDTPRRVASSCGGFRIRTPSSVAGTTGVNVRISGALSNNTVLTPGPTLSASTSILASTSAATIASALPTSASALADCRQNLIGNSSPSSLPTFLSLGASSAHGPISSSTARSARIMNNIRRGSAFCAYLSGMNRSYGFSEEDWNRTSESDEE